jgi:hypothetical protein
VSLRLLGHNFFWKSEEGRKRTLTHNATMSTYAVDEWIESIDPNTGRKFYANRITRTTQWDPPVGWNDASRHHGEGMANDATSSSASASAASAMMSMLSNNATNDDNYEKYTGYNDYNNDDDALPDGWEEMTDQNTGRKFYVDHTTKATTWNRPRKERGDGRGGGGRPQQPQSTSPSSPSTMMMNEMKLNQRGGHRRWEDDPRVGGRGSSYASEATRHHHHRHQFGNESPSSSSHAGPPPLAFVVVSVPDMMRTKCPGCENAFTYTRRRHHCRLCGVSVVPFFRTRVR